MRWIPHAVAAFLVLAYAGSSHAQPGSTPSPATDFLADQIEDLGQDVEQNTQQAELSLAQSQGAADVLGEAQKLLEAIEKANQAQEDAKDMAALLDLMSLAAVVDTLENTHTPAEIDAIKAMAQDKVDEARDDAARAEGVAQRAKDRLLALFPGGLFGVRWTWPLFPFFLLLLINTGLLVMLLRRREPGQRGFAGGGRDGGNGR